MTATTRSRDVAVLPLLRSTTWRSAVHVLTDMWAGILTFTAMVVLLSITVSLAITVVLAVPFAWATIVAARWLGRMERARARVLLGVDVADPHTPRAGGWWSRLRQAVVSGAVWREIGYHLLLLPLGLVGWTLAVVAWSGSLFLVTLPATVWLMPDDVADLGPIEAGIGGATGLALLGGVALCVVAPWITTTWARLDAALVRGLLGPSA